jgi:hypothetical protein
MDLASAKARLIASLRVQIRDDRVLLAFASVPRECFVPPRLQALAYSDEPLPIGHHQTISQPLIVAMMTEALELKGSEKVLAAVIKQLFCPNWLAWSSLPKGFRSCLNLRLPS